MTNANFNVEDLIRLAQSELKKREFGQDFMLSDVCNISRRAYEQFPEDAVIRQFSFVVEKLAEKRGPNSTINQKEMNEIYNNFVRLGSESKFREVMGMFVFGQEQPKLTVQAENRSSTEHEPMDLTSDLDKELAAGIKDLFGEKVVADQLYNEQMAQAGVGFVKDELKSIGFNNVNVRFAGGDSNGFVYNANFDTLSGLVSVAIPIEVSSGKLGFPSVFATNDRFEQLTAPNLRDFIDKKAKAYDFSVPEPKAVLKAVAILTGKVKTASNEFEQILSKLGGGEFVGEKNELDYPVNLSTMSAMADDRNEVIPDNKKEEGSYDMSLSSNIAWDQKAEMPKELAHLAHDFEDTILESASSFGKNAVQAGRNIVAAELASAGFKNSQIRFASESNDSVVYNATLNTAKGAMVIEVPVEMKETNINQYQPLLPSVFACDGVIEDFTPTKLQRFIIRHTPSTGQRVCASEHSYMTLPELKEQILKYANDGDYVECEMALGTIQERFGDEHYKNAIEDYHWALSLKNKQGAKIERRCSREIPAGKTSIEPVCGHHGVPMSKVVVGEDGQCRLKSSIEREKLNPVEESGVGISTSKIFLS